jgi:hypothetical protein
MSQYLRLASFIRAHPEEAIFRRFGALNAHNLLLLQAELISLEAELKRCSDEDAASGHDYRKFYRRDWETLSKSHEHEGSSTAQLDVIMKIRDKLKEYSQ